MALNASLSATGNTQGQLSGGSTQAGREGTSAVNGYEQTTETPIDPTTGQPTGQPGYGEVEITKEIDPMTTDLQNAQANGEVLSEVVIRFYRPSHTGQEVQFYTVTLTNARVVRVHHEMLNTKDPEGMRMPIQEKVKFTYERITYTFEEGGKTAEGANKPARRETK